MNTNPERFYFIDNDRLALVEKNGTITTDGASTAYKTISERKPVRINTICRADHFVTGNDIAESDWISPTAGPLGHIPTQFHEALVYKVIGMGYKTPPALNLELAMFFDIEYKNIIIRAKKFARSNYMQTGFIAPQDF
jgi:hypothetical protein